MCRINRKKTIASVCLPLSSFPFLSSFTSFVSCLSEWFPVCGYFVFSRLSIFFCLRFFTVISLLSLFIYSVFCLFGCFRFLFVYLYILLSTFLMVLSSCLSLRPCVCPPVNTFPSFCLLFSPARPPTCLVFNNTPTSTPVSFVSFPPLIPFYHRLSLFPPLPSRLANTRIDFSFPYNWRGGLPQRQWRQVGGRAGASRVRNRKKYHKNSFLSFLVSVPKEGICSGGAFVYRHFSVPFCNDAALGDDCDDDTLQGNNAQVI